MGGLFRKGLDWGNFLDQCRHIIQDIVQEFTRNLQKNTDIRNYYWVVMGFGTQPCLSVFFFLLQKYQVLGSESFV